MLVTSSIPIPAVRVRVNYPFDEMQIGDSFLADGKKIRQLSVHVWRSAAKRGHQYTCKTVDDGVRVWRTA